MIQFIKSTKLKNDYPVSDKEVVIVGRSNVGKSSFINALYNQKLAYVGKTAGKTRLLNFFNINNEYTMVDVPGYGYANRSGKELVEFGQMMDDYFTKRECLKLVIMLVDIRHKPTKDDIEMMEYLRYHHLNILVVANKSDKLSYSKCLEGRKLISEVLGINKDFIIMCSSLKKTNFDIIKEKINQAINK